MGAETPGPGRARLLAGLLLFSSAAWCDEFPAWAYPACPPSRPPPDPNPAQVVRLPDSPVRFTRAEVENWALIADWFPSAHSAMPSVVAASQSPQRAACGFCHLPDGNGRPENAKLAGLPAAYIATQVKAFHVRARRSAKSDWAATDFMVNATAGIPDSEIARAADYYSRQVPISHVRVREQSSIGSYEVSRCAYRLVPGAAVPLGTRIIEVPDDPDRFELRDPRTTYTAYVPRGSLRRGALLARQGRPGDFPPCGDCHGPNLRGGADASVPPLAGRFPAYLFRQLYSFQSGYRSGEAAKPMQSVTARLTQRDMIDLAAFAASR